MAEAESPSQKPHKKTPKEWDLDDEEFEYAPPKPEGDPWNALLKPLLEKDKIRCDGWKEEVQNLLIFAGLFSAVVTAFVVESYRSLRPDPNDAIVGLLSHIASRLDNPVNGTATFNIPSFTPTPSSIRVNVFWFLSLILSLTTVLVGIVTLQWLREYQSYPGLSPKETRAVFRMRSEGMERWYVWNIFVALPLLLQAALVLFLGGIVDFLLPLNNKVAIPVALVVGSTLLFLIATTVLPTLHGLFLHIPFLFFRDLTIAPSQCPYKSPQSHAFRMTFSPSFTLFHYTFPAVRALFRRSPNSRLGTQSNIEQENHHVVPQLLTTWQKKTWMDFDSAWLLLRDACVQGMKDQQHGLSDHRQDLSPGVTNLFDSVRAIQEAIQDPSFNHTDTSRSVIYHCFSDLSKSFLTDDWSKRYYAIDEDIFHRQHGYFHALWHENDAAYESEYKAIYSGTRMWDPDSDLTTFHRQNLYSFTRKNKPVLLLLDHWYMEELAIRLSKCWGTQHLVHPSAWESRLPRHLTDLSSYRLVWRLSRMHFWQYSHVIMAFFRYAAKNDHPLIHPQYFRLHDHPGVVDFLENAASITVSATERSFPGDTTIQDEVDLYKAYQAIILYIGDRLRHSLPFTRVKPEDTVQPDLYLFYTSAIYVRRLVRLVWTIRGVTSTNDSMEALLQVMRHYKRQTIDVGGVNEFLERQFKGEDRNPKIIRFSKKWWSFLGDDIPGSPSSQEPPLDSLQIATRSKEWWPFLNDDILGPTSSQKPPLDSLQIAIRDSDVSNDNANQIAPTSSPNHTMISVEYPQSEFPPGK